MDFLWLSSSEQRMNSRQTIKKNPFLKNRKTDLSKLHVTFLSQAPLAGALDQMRKVKDEADDFRVADKEIYLYCPRGYGKTKLSNSFFEKILSVAATTRNWKTVNMLLDIAKK